MCFKAHNMLPCTRADGNEDILECLIVLECSPAKVPTAMVDCESRHTSTTRATLNLRLHATRYLLNRPSNLYPGEKGHSHSNRNIQLRGQTDVKKEAPLKDSHSNGGEVMASPEAQATGIAASASPAGQKLKVRRVLFEYS